MVGDVNVAACDARSFAATLRWLYHALPEPDQTAQVEAMTHNLAPDDLLFATAGGEFQGVIICEVAAGRVGWVWPPVTRASDETDPLASAVARRLIDRAVARLSRGGARVAQVLAPLTCNWGDAFIQNGFHRLTELIRMERDVGDAPPAASPDRVRFVDCSRFSDALLQQLIFETYRGSCDCAELDGLRPIDEVLEGYRSAGVFDPSLWQVLLVDTEPRGCVLLTHWPDEDRCELQYMGVVPDARGRGLGRAMCVRAIDEARRVGASRLTLSVDARNEPALRHYRASQFREIEHRLVFFRVLD